MIREGFQLIASALRGMAHRLPGNNKASFVEELEGAILVVCILQIGSRTER
jgi:hypothetical protein